MGSIAELGDLAGAIKDFDAAIGLDSNDANPYYNRGLAYTGLGDLSRAVEDFSRAIAFDADLPEAYHNRGAALPGPWRTR